MNSTEFVAELDQEAVATRRVLERVPGDKLDWRPHPKAMSLGQLALHVATVPALASMLSQPEVDVSMIPPTPPAAESSESLLPALESSLAEAKQIVGGMDEAAFSAVWRLVDGEREIMAQPRGALLRSIMLNHWYHHRGQLTTYLRFLDVPLPSVYGPSADENPFA